MKMFKRLYLITFVLFLCSVSFAQTAKMSIDGKPQKSSSEFVGVRDVNGRICAAIQVISDMDGFAYKSNNGVVRVDDDPGQDMVYLSPDERVLEIYKTGFEPLKIILSEYGIQLKQKDVWKIKIKGSAKTGDLLPVTVFVQPQDANITIDGKTVSAGQAVKLSKGSHSLRISKEGFKTKQENITVSEKNVVFNYTLSEVELEQVLIKSVPTEARIYLDNIEKGTTDYGFFLYPGLYQLKLSKTGYLEVNKSITVSEGGNNTFTFPLSKNSGILQLSVKPAGANIKLNQRDYTGKSYIELLPGKYELEIFQTGYLPQKESIEIERGKTQTRNYTLIKNSGILQLSVKPAGANIKLNQRDYTGKSRIELLPGKYELEIFQTGYLPQKESIEIERGKTQTRNFTLIKNSGSLILSITPDGAKILINKEDYTSTGSVRGSKIIELAPGRYKIELAKPGYNAQSETITMIRGQTLRKTYSLIAKTGKLQFKVKPLTANVTLKKNGRTVQSWTGMKYIKDLQVGSYELQCTASGYGTQIKRITIEEQRTAILDIKLNTLNKPSSFAKPGRSSSSSGAGTMTDQEGNVYKTVKIGNQIWMAENLKVTRYRNGDAIPNVTDNTQWANLSAGAYCSYNTDNGNINTYGLLYNWYAAVDSRNIAPAGWHVPTDEEWEQLEKYLGSDAGGKLKERGMAHWENPNTGATNSSGFTALSGGYRYGNLGAFDYMGRYGLWWSATESSSHYAWNRHLDYKNSVVLRFSLSKQDGFSVRLVRD